VNQQIDYIETFDLDVWPDLNGIPSIARDIESQLTDFQLPNRAVELFVYSKTNIEINRIILNLFSSPLSFNCVISQHQTDVKQYIRRQGSAVSVCLSIINRLNPCSNSATLIHMTSR